MGIAGYVEYRRREYCKAVGCPVQSELGLIRPNTPEYERVRKMCQTSCRHTTYEFHHWLIEKGYVIVRSQK